MMINKQNVIPIERIRKVLQNQTKSWTPLSFLGFEAIRPDLQVLLYITLGLIRCDIEVLTMQCSGIKSRWKTRKIENSSKHEFCLIELDYNCYHSKHDIITSTLVLQAYAVKFLDTHLAAIQQHAESNRISTSVPKAMHNFKHLETKTTTDHYRSLQPELLIITRTIRVPFEPAMGSA